MAITRDELVRLLAEQLPGATVEATDLTGTADHWQLAITWPGFAGMKVIDKHRRVMDILRPHMEGGGSGRIHAVDLILRAPEAPAT